MIRDRDVDSSLAYQGWARGLGETDVLTLNVWATQGLFPVAAGLHVFRPERGLLRSTEVPRPDRARGRQDFHAKVAEAYIRRSPRNIRSASSLGLDGDETPDEVFIGAFAYLLASTLNANLTIWRSVRCWWSPTPDDRLDPSNSGDSSKWLAFLSAVDRWPISRLWPRRGKLKMTR